MNWLTTIDHADYLIVNLPFDISGIIDTDNDLWRNIKLIDIFQANASKYLLVKCTKQLLPLVFNVYQESSYEFKLLIPWYKTQVMDSNVLFALTGKINPPIDYILLFETPNATGLHKIPSNFICEDPDPDTGLPISWINLLTSYFSEYHQRGKIISFNKIQDALDYPTQKSGSFELF